MSRSLDDEFLVKKPSVECLAVYTRNMYTVVTYRPPQREQTGIYDVFGVFAAVHRVYRESIYNYV